MDFYQQAPIKWKIITMNNLTQRGIDIYSSKILLQEKFNYLRHIRNDHPTTLVNNGIKLELSTSKP